MLIKNGPNGIVARGIVQQPQHAGERESTYDATVGTIISKGKEVGPKFVLEPRGVVWVISKEDFHLPTDLTAVAALRTTWAHNGIFALNVGVIDPGWKGPVATALVNFSTEDFEVSHGNAFMRLMFFEHQATHPTQPVISREEYIKKVKKNSRDFSESFLSMNLLVDEVAQEIFKLPRIGVAIAWAGLAIAVASIFVPIAYSTLSGVHEDKMKIIALEHRLDQIEKENKVKGSDVKENALQPNALPRNIIPLKADSKKNASLED